MFAFLPAHHDLKPCFTLLRAVPEPRNADWVLATTDYGSPFIAAVGKGNIYATQVPFCLGWLAKAW